MGTYYFTSAADGSKTKVEYTFGYKKNADGKVRIFLHHSSVPFEAPAKESKGLFSGHQGRSIIDSLIPSFQGRMVKLSDRLVLVLSF